MIRKLTDVRRLFISISTVHSPCLSVSLSYFSWAMHSWFFISQQTTCCGAQVLCPSLREGAMTTVCFHCPTLPVQGLWVFQVLQAPFSCFYLLHYPSQHCKCLAASPDCGVTTKTKPLSQLLYFSHV